MVNANCCAAGYRYGQFKVEVFLRGQDNQKILVKIMRDSTLANNQKTAKQLISSLFLNDYIIDETIFESDEYYLSHDPEIRRSQIGTHHHPMDNSHLFDQYKTRECKYNYIFSDFLNGVINKDDLIKRIEKVTDDEIIEDCTLFAQVEMIDLDTKIQKTARLLSVD